MSKGDANRCEKLSNKGSSVLIFVVVLFRTVGNE